MDGARVTIIPEVKDDVIAFPRPDSTPALRRFLGKMNVYRNFIKDMASIATPLYERTGPQIRFEWSEPMERAFVELNKRLSEAISFFHPDYTRSLILETDASDTGIGSVLLQRNDENQTVPVRWISRNLSSAERNHGIAEKELLGVVWSIKHPDYVLRGRRFSVITDHKALAAIKAKDDFSNPQMHWLISSMQEYDFDISYRPGSKMHGADALSRVYERTNKSNQPITSIEELQADEGSQEGTVPDQNDHREDDNEKLKLVQKIHEDLLHCGTKAMLYELGKTVNWPDLRRLVAMVLSKCKICNKNNRKHGGGANFIDTEYRLEKTALDIMKVGGQFPYVLIFIDFYARIMRLHSLRSRSTKEIIAVLENWFTELGIPKELNTDNALEFTSSKFQSLCRSHKIRHHRTSIEKHEANGRVERAIRTVRDGLDKTKNQGRIVARLSRIQDTYNRSLHIAIGMSPTEAWADTGDTLHAADSATVNMRNVLNS